MSEIKKTKVSDLPEEMNPTDSWIFGYKAINGVQKSVKVKWNALLKIVEDAVDSVHLKADQSAIKGYHISLAELQAVYPKAANRKGYFAWCGTPYPGTVHVVKQDGGEWVDTEQVPPVEVADLGEYAKHATIYNVSQDKNKYDYATSQDARNAVIAAKRGVGQLVSYKLVGGKWVFERFIGTDIAQWGDASKWESTGSMNIEEREELFNTPIANSLLKRYIAYNLNLYLAGNVIQETPTTSANSINRFPLEEGATYNIKCPSGTNHQLMIDNLVTGLARGYKVAELTYTAKRGDRFCLLIKWSDLDITNFTNDDLLITKVSATKKYMVIPTVGDLDVSAMVEVRAPQVDSVVPPVATSNGFIGIRKGDNPRVEGSNECRMVTAEVLPGYTYEIDMGAFIKIGVPAVVQSFTGVRLQTRHGIAMGGRRKTYIHVPHVAEATRYQILFMYAYNVNGLWKDGTFDQTGKYKITRLGRSSSLLDTPFSDAKYTIETVTDLSEKPHLEIAEPKWIKINFNADYGQMCSSSSYSKRKMPFEYLDSNGIYFKKYAEVGAQGSSSMQWTNRNSKYKLYNIDGSKFMLTIGDWLPRNTYHLKVNYVDFTQAKNLGGARFVHKWYNTDPDKKYPFDKAYNRATATFEDEFEHRPRTVIAGVPCIVMTHGNHYCNGTFNLNAFAENMALSKDNPLHRGYRGGNTESSMINKNIWEEMVSGQEKAGMTQEVWQPLEDFLNWWKINRTTANRQVFIDNADIRYNKKEMIDYYLFAELKFSWDSFMNNLVMVTYDGIKFNPYWYDMDTTFGDSFTGNHTFPPTSNMEGRTGFLYETIVAAFPNEIKARYKDLRAKAIFSVANVLEVYGGIIDTYPYEWYEKDYYMWKSDARASTKVGNIAHKNYYKWWVGERLRFLDTKYGYGQ